MLNRKFDLGFLVLCLLGYSGLMGHRSHLKETLASAHQRKMVMEAVVKNPIATESRWNITTTTASSDHSEPLIY